MECSIRYPETPMFVYGDFDDMSYALGTSKWLGANVQRMELVGKTPFIADVNTPIDPGLFDKEKLKLIGRASKGQKDFQNYLKLLHARVPADQK